MLVDLVQTVATDGVYLDGALHTPPARTESTVGVDALLCLHGTGSNFYNSTLWAGLIPKMLGWGTAVLAVNTRGHDGISGAVTLHGRRQQGAAYEVVDESRHDVAGWLKFLVDRGYSRVAILGHSLGGIKGIYAMSHQPHAAVKCLLNLSPPRLSHSWFCQSVHGADFQKEYAAAVAHMQEGRRDFLMKVRFPLPSIITAAGYLDKYGPDERYNLLNFFDRVSCPMLFTYGTLELATGVAFQGLPEILEGKAKEGLSVRVAVVAGADHVYTGTHSELSGRLEAWLRQTLVR